VTKFEKMMGCTFAEMGLIVTGVGVAIAAVVFSDVGHNIASIFYSVSRNLP